jgi:hypothetical protein
VVRSTAWKRAIRGFSEPALSIEALEEGLLPIRKLGVVHRVQLLYNAGKLAVVRLQRRARIGCRALPGSMRLRSFAWLPIMRGWIGSARQPRLAGRPADRVGW